MVEEGDGSIDVTVVKENSGVTELTVSIFLDISAAIPGSAQNG